MTTLCLSLLQYDEPQVLINHRHYCARSGYAHAFASVKDMQSQAHRILFKYELILHHLRRLPEAALLACLSDDCVIIGMHRIETLAHGRDDVLVSIRDDAGTGSEAQTALQIWRNTPATRAHILRCIERAKLTRDLDAETSLHAELDYVPPDAQLAGVQCAVRCNVRSAPRWADQSAQSTVWTLILADIPLYAGTHSLFRRAIFEHINDWQQKGVPLLTFAVDDSVPDVPYSVDRPEQPIAIVTSYTPNIRQFGVIAERNFRRYCARHGYALHVYRQAPPDAEAGLSGAWLKPWFLSKHLSEHEWVIWLDADILFLDQRQPLEPWLAGRDILASHDIGPWVINSGVFGLRRTPGNRQLIDAILQRIRAVPDKSSTYASGGDQTVIANFLTHELGWTLEQGVDCIGLNTPWFYQQDSSLMVHYYGMATALRALMMSAQDRRGWQL